jgi:hypothetical protein
MRLDIADANQCCGSGSGIQCFFDSGIRDGKKSGSGMNIPDNISESLETVFGLKILKLFDANPSPGRNLFFLTLDPGWKNSDPQH